MLFHHGAQVLDSYATYFSTHDCEGVKRMNRGTFDFLEINLGAIFFKGSKPATPVQKVQHSF
jgi:hypothetical protein